jgi:threonylcarbamoyladenosine tRNA methylthiotransferase MtaB
MSDVNIEALKGNNQVITFGCRLNIYESEVIKKLIRDENIENHIIVNTCAVTNEAERQARQMIRRLHKEHPDKKIIVTGCGAQIHPEQFLTMTEVSKVIGNQEKLDKSSYKSNKSQIVGDIMIADRLASPTITHFDNKVRAYFQIQNGCNHRCTFCTIPFGRGNSRSVPVGDIVKSIQDILNNGVKEIVLTGVDMTDYGLDLPGQPTLSQMVRRLLNLCPDLHRLRLSSLDPVEVDDDFFDLFQNPRIMPHLHISLQAADDMILKRMKRRHLRHHIIEFCQKARKARPDVMLGADIIAGFPTETDEMFDNTRRIVEECYLTFLHVFPYSKREGTPAARMPQVPSPTIKKRAKILREEGEKVFKRLAEFMVGQTVLCLIEKNGFGKTDHFCPVQIAVCPAQPGDIIPVFIDGYTDKTLTGKI